MEQCLCLMMFIFCGVAQVLGMPQQETGVGTSSSVSDLPVFNNTFGNDDYDNNTATTNSTDNGAHSTGCVCVPFYLCDEKDIIIEDGHGLLDLRSKREVCNAYDEKCCKFSNIRQQAVEDKPTNHVCGTRNIDGIGFVRRRRATGDEDDSANYGEFPWMVALIRRLGDKMEYRCGGSLIHPQVVLTAAHCVSGKDSLVIRVGEYDTGTAREIYSTHTHEVRETIVHEQFKHLSLINNIALLILEDPVDMTWPNVGLICLPEEDENMDGRECVTSGWGKDKFGKEGKYQVILKKIDVPVIQRELCLEALQRTRLTKHFKLHPSFICAGGKLGKDPCKGDGGSPLACPSKGNNESYVQAGIVAWGIGCGTETPGVYVNVPAFVPWIKNQLQQHDIFLS